MGATIVPLLGQRAFGAPRVDTLAALMPLFMFGPFRGSEQKVSMKEGIHPNSHPVIFVDGEHEWYGVSTITTNETREVEGVKYYVVPVEISAFSHPFYTGQKKLVDTAGRIERFRRKYGLTDSSSK